MSDKFELEFLAVSLLTGMLIFSASGFVFEFELNFMFCLLPSELILPNSKNSIYLDY